LPLDFWSKSGYEDISNVTDQFFYLDLKLMGTIEKKVAWLPMEVNSFGGLSEKIDLQLDQFHVRQQLDYWDIPLRCLIFHHISHLMAICPHKFLDQCQGTFQESRC